MSKKLVRLITIIIAIAMVASLAAGCGGNANTDIDDPNNNTSDVIDENTDEEGEDENTDEEGEDEESDEEGEDENTDEEGEDENTDEEGEDENTDEEGEDENTDEEGEDENTDEDDDKNSSDKSSSKKSSSKKSSSKVSSDKDSDEDDDKTSSDKSSSKKSSSKKSSSKKSSSKVSSDKDSDDEDDDDDDKSSSKKSSSKKSSSKKSSSKKSSSKKSSSKKSSSKKSSSKNSSTSSGNNDSTGKVNPEDYRGDTVTYVTWKDPKLNEDGPVVKDFEDKYGIKVNIQLVEQKNYVSIIASNIAAGTQGDIFFETETFPGSLTVMQPLDAAKLDLSDPIWNQDLIKASTLDGHAYLVDTMSNIWSERTILVYNKNIFQNNNITTPADYVKQGKWTFENFRYVCNQIKGLGKAYKGAALIGEPAIASCGASFFEFKDNKMVVTADKRLYDAMNLLSSMKQDGLVSLGYEAFGDGSFGMAITNCFALKKTGYYTNFNSSHLAATYVPSWSENEESVNSSLFRGWGLIDGAKNPVAAGIFLREYLDVNNYDFSTAFHNDDVASFFFKVIGDTSTRKYYYGGAMCRIYNNDTRIHEAWAKETPATMNSYLDGQKNVMNNMANKANADIEKERKYLKETFGG